ncbi:M1 family metallopeptidase [Actinosynnema sp. NPDC047251]|uniref:Peptidase M1, membrane alanine aminopeptidase n=1 Tax=Saccharothrix espanaensis (strain ATCC 51144 / DSM 44229 / JCM 9112 / NBRC 15066 / NRRL 15764) TaxID=1179773 RepID=K0JUS4_SACES|nr:M1 family metallopeptidase [Saccharothrix espanaensis]CCH29701.1 Peptidase M1, membrane alanine aminopeptidase [Saccharothrix espanaensis DSM 44229]
MAVRIRRTVTSATLLLCGLSLCAPPAHADDTIGTDGYVHVAPNGTVLGVDPYYPTDGNGGYDVADYAVSLSYDPNLRFLTARTVVTATTTQRLSRFDLDLRGLSVTSVKVDGVPAKFSRAKEHELVITPATALAAGTSFKVEVVYCGRPVAESTPRGVTGWRVSRTGGAFAAGAPHSASTWFPVNDTTADKATFHLDAAVPPGWTVVSNGVRDKIHKGRWSEETPIAPSATVIGVDRFTVRESALPGGTPVLDAFAPGTSTALAASLPAVVEFLAGKLGPYPYSTAGGMYVADRLAYTHPAQGRPVYGASADQAALVRAVAAQWWGNKLAIKMWQDQPLVESFAWYLVWLWEESRGGLPVEQRYQEGLGRADTAFWARKLADPGRGREFAVTDKGVLMVHALRKKIGDDKFFAVLREFPEINDNWNQGWHDWELYTAAVADLDLTAFYEAWVHGTTAPPAEHR